MAHISIQNLTVEFKIYGSSSRSLKKQILSQATGGRISKSEDDTISVKAIDKLSLEINHGDRIGLLGHNGSGKSTLLRTIASIYKPTKGRIEIEGKVSSLIDTTAGMDPEATGIENIYLRGYMLGMDKVEVEQKIDGIVEFTELGNYIHLPFKIYSVGMSSRLSFAISTSIEPDILLIDEGLGAGDARFMDKVTKRIDELISKAQILVFASHNKDLIEKMCNRTITLQAEAS